MTTIEFKFKLRYVTVHVRMRVCVNVRLVTGHFGHKTLRHQDTLGHFGTDLKTLRRQNNVVRDTSTRVP